MALDQAQNFVNVKVSGTHNSLNTSIQLEAGEASELPDPANREYNLVWFDEEEKAPDLDPNVEIVRVTAVDTNNDIITVQRGQENTSAVAHNDSGAVYRMILPPTAKLVKDLPEGIAGTFLSDDGTDNLTVDVGNGLGNDGSGNIAIQSNSIQTDELDQSAAYDFSSQIDFTGGIGNNGSGIAVNDNLDLSQSNDITDVVQISMHSSVDNTESLIINGDTAFIRNNNSNRSLTIDQNTSNSIDIRNLGGGVIQFFTTDSGGSNSERIQIDSGVDAPQFRLQNGLELRMQADGGAKNLMDMSVTGGPSVGTEESLSISVDGNNFIKAYAEADGAGGIQNSEIRASQKLDMQNNNINDVASIDGGGDAISVDDPINLSASDSIQDAGVDAIQFDGSANVTIPNGNLNLNSNSINGVNNIDKSDSTGILEFADPTNGAILHLNNDTTVNVQPTTTQPGTSSNPSVGIGDGGAGFYIDSNGEIVAVDEAGNTTVIS